MAALLPAVHAAARKYESGIRAALCKSLQMQLSLACLWALDAPNRVDGRDKHGHDARPARGTSKMIAQL
jgi:hypothetical protein